MRAAGFASPAADGQGVRRLLNARAISRVLSAGLLVVANTWARQAVATYWHKAGVSEFLARQSRNFARWYAGPESFILSFLKVTLFTVSGLIAYELLALGIYFIIRKKRVADGA